MPSAGLLWSVRRYVCFIQVGNFLFTSDIIQTRQT